MRLQEGKKLTRNSTDPVLGYLPGSKKDEQSITKNWESLQPMITGVVVKEVRNVVKDNGHLTEIYRKEWDEMGEVHHVFQQILHPGKLTAWHLHTRTTDQFFVSSGLAKIVLYDARETSCTQGVINVFRFGSFRPGFVVVPPGIWHGVMNIGIDVSVVLNFADRVYAYEDPDHWRLPPDTSQIPYRFT
jgi:dTDP-4-dehydrorhamnose 3,5-epimerase